MRGERRHEPEQIQLSDTAMAHLYRGELGRSDRWRTRLDTTTNWALTTTAAVISFGFANTGTSHITMLVGIWMVTTFLLIEARRYRYYDLWNRRLRLLEDGYWAPMLRHEPIDPDAMKELALELSRPQIQLSLFSAVSTRLNRAYGPILLVLLLTWFVKVFSHPEPASTFTEFLDRARVGPIPGALIMTVLAVITFFYVALLIGSFFARAPLGELRMRPRTRKMELWERFYRPYATTSPRQRPRPRLVSRPTDPSYRPPPHGVD